ncbi:hypothetical protein [Corallococcus sp. RDP092CA]|uniref:hypothetical protein n=1 Tax=Corallococcus sp. RDP092CA TaxID=3109369 RepID=UPI0035B309AB
MSAASQSVPSPASPGLVAAPWIHSAPNHGQCWYSVPKPRWMGKAQLRCLKESRLYQALAGHSKLLLVHRILWRWRQHGREARPLREAGPASLRPLLREFTLFSAGYTELRELLGHERAHALYSEMFLATGEMEMDWLWPSAETFLAGPEPLDGLLDYWTAYLRAYERMAVHEVLPVERGPGAALARTTVRGSLFHDVFHRLGCPELSPLVHRMEVAALNKLGAPLGVSVSVGCRQHGATWECDFVFHPQEGPSVAKGP